MLTCCTIVSIKNLYSCPSLASSLLKLPQSMIYQIDPAPLILFISMYFWSTHLPHSNHIIVKCMRFVIFIFVFCSVWYISICDSLLSGLFLFFLHLKFSSDYLWFYPAKIFNILVTNLYYGILIILLNTIWIPSTFLTHFSCLLLTVAVVVCSWYLLMPTYN